jgi:LPXTG-site transpeptidase (sortase) family protein
VRITVNSVSYSNNGGAGPFLATLNINNGGYLPLGTYRLFICGTSSIYDPAGNRLNNGLDSVLNFTVARVTALPATGFAPGRVTQLGPQAVQYASLGDLWLEIPSLGLQMPIVGVPNTNGNWDVSWLGTNAGWLQGSAYPSWAGNSVLTGHVWNADNSRGPFASLNQLWYGNRIVVHAFGQEYVYEVRSIRRIQPDGVNAVFQHEELPWLTLLTCNSYSEDLGAYRYRLIVRAVQVEMR